MKVVECDIDQCVVRSSCSVVMRKFGRKIKKNWNCGGESEMKAF